MKKKLILIIINLGLVIGIYAQTNTYPTTGNVGIGTPAPMYKLDVVGTIGNTAGIFSNLKSSGYNALTIGDNIAGYASGSTSYTGPLVLSLTATKNGDGMLYIKLYFFSNTRMQKLDIVTYWWSDGINVPDWTGGTGVYNPIYRAFYSGDQIVSKVRFGFYNGKQVLVFGDATTAWANSTVAYVKEASQYWGGGYDMSTWTLQPFTGSDADISYLRTANVGRESQLPFWDANGNDAYSLNSGNIGIGTTTPGYKLDVCGTVRAKEVKVDLQGSCTPDFVFAPTYQLRPLSEVEKYVKANSHLPEIPSAAEVAQNGLSLGDMQNKLLQKVEELTLYTIEQDKKNAELQEKIKKLEELINQKLK